METVSFFPALLKMISALAVVLGVMVGLAFLVRRFFPQTGMGGADGAPIQILAVRHLGHKSSIMIVDILGQAVVIGVSNQQMSYITTIDDAASLEKLAALSPKRTSPAASVPLDRYREIVKSLIGTKQDGKRP